MFSCIWMLKHFIKKFNQLSYSKSEKKVELSELIELHYWKTPSQMSSYAHKHVSLYSNKHLYTFLLIPHKNTIIKFTYSINFVQGCNQPYEIPNFLKRKWKPCFSQICQIVEDWLFSRLHNTPHPHSIKSKWFSSFLRLSVSASKF